MLPQIPPARIAGLALTLLFLGNSTLYGQGNKGEMLGEMMKRFLKAPDPVRATVSARVLAPLVLPSPEQLRERGEWKLPWEIPEDMVFNPAVLTGNIKIGRQTEANYWENLGHGSVFVGLKHADARKNIDELMLALSKEGLEVGGDLAASIRRLMLIEARSFPSLVHPTTPTLAVALGRSLELTRYMARYAGELRDADKAKAPEKMFKRMIEIQEALAPELNGLSEEQLKEAAIDAMVLNKKLVQMSYFRTNNWSELSSLLQARKEGKLKGRDGRSIGMEDALKERGVLSVAVRVTVRLIDANALERIAAADDAAQDVLEKRLRNVRDLVPPEEAAGLGALPTVERLKELGQRPCVVTVPYRENKGTYLAASLQNGVFITDIEMFSEMTGVEARADLDLFMRLMHEKTLWGRAAAGERK